jgi:heptosyltransferase-2
MSKNRILIVGPAWVGDMVMTQSLCITLKQRLPDCEIDVLAPAWSRPLLARMPEVKGAVMMPLDHGQFGYGVRKRLGWTLWGRYAQAIVLPRSWKSALVPFFASIPVRTGYRGEMRYVLINDIRPLDKKALNQTVQRFVALGLEKGAKLPPQVPQPRLRVDERNRNQVLDILGLDAKAPIVAMMPGAEYGPAKRWPLERYGELAKRLTAAGRQVWVFGSAKEQALGEEILKAAGPDVQNLCGSTKLGDVVDLLSLCESAVTNDSGLMHVAAAVGIKLIALYGSSTPDYTPPLSDKAEAVYLRLECSPCFQRECPLKHLNCLKQIAVDDIYGRIMGTR